MKKYSIKTPKKDFKFLETNYNIKGSRPKKLVIDKNGKKAMFKYERSDYIVSEACSEKMSYEIATILGYHCAKIELAKDETESLGVLNYLFINLNNTEHTDAVSYLNIHKSDRAQFYTISNIKQRLDELNKNLFKDFIKILVFDALIGEQDRHEENWGIEKKDNTYKISPLYDNGCNLLREFKDESFAKQFYHHEKDFYAYIKRSKTMIYKEDHKTKYKHFELIEYLNQHYHNAIQMELMNLMKLTDQKIEEVVMKIPDELLTKEHKNYIIMYLKERRDILLKIK